MTETLADRLAADRTLAVVRADEIPDAAELAAALAAGGIRVVELTFTTPRVASYVRRIAETASEHGALVGVGTVMTAEQAREAVDAGAQFLVTPGIREDVAAVARQAQIPFSLGAMTPTEVGRAMELGSEPVKIFPAGTLGPRYLKDLQGPYPGVQLLPSGGISADNAAEFLAVGAAAVCCGTSVVPPALVRDGGWAEIAERAASFTASLEAARP
ncbi:bifunctional 4-hydroxy-2-oxoglutarate aldolase/2-dehydro-3-deoxy-phosphogluconate aldolase [Nesterenkonia halophila]